MAGLKPYLVDNVLYVTTPENAALLEKPNRQRARTDRMEGLPPPPPFGPRIGGGRKQPPDPPPLP